MSGVRRRAIVALVIAWTLGGVTSVLPVTAAANPNREGRLATEIGITSDTIRIAVIADVDNPQIPGLFQSVVDGVEAGVNVINQRGGLAGRTLQVDFIDSHLSADEARNALIRACEEDFALVGTTALLLNDVEPMTDCIDKAQRATGLPDIPVLQSEFEHQCSPVSYPIIVFGLDCATRNDPRPRFDVAVGPQLYFSKRFGDLHGQFILPGDSRSAMVASLPVVAAMDEVGIDIDRVVTVSGRDTQAAYTPIVQSIEQDRSTYIAVRADYRADVLVRREAALQGVTGVKVWDCPVQCYDTRFLTEGGADVEGQFVIVFFVPFEEAAHNRSVSRYLRFAGGRESADGYGALGWAATLLFRDVVQRIVKADGANGLTRARVLEEIARIHDFTADGMIGPTDIGARKRSTCFAILQVRQGKFVRVFPKRKASFDCGSELRSVRVDLAG